MATRVTLTPRSEYRVGCPSDLSGGQTLNEQEVRNGNRDPCKENSSQLRVCCAAMGGKGLSQDIQKVSVKRAH